MTGEEVTRLKKVGCYFQHSILSLRASGQNIWQTSKHGYGDVVEDY